VLGRRRKLGAGERGLPADHTFGKPSMPKVRRQLASELRRYVAELADISFVAMQC
jgi:hypothetical protein